MRLRGWRQTCGSDYDSHGNFRFAHPDALITSRVLHASTYTDNLNFGIMSFDNIGAAALILFICIPREGWYVVRRCYCRFWGGTV